MRLLCHFQTRLVEMPAPILASLPPSLIPLTHTRIRKSFQQKQLSIKRMMERRMPDEPDGDKVQSKVRMSTLTKRQRGRNISSLLCMNITPASLLISRRSITLLFISYYLFLFR